MKITIDDIPYSDFKKFHSELCKEIDERMNTMEIYGQPAPSSTYNIGNNVVLKDVTIFRVEYFPSTKIVSFNNEFVSETITVIVEYFRRVK